MWQIISGIIISYFIGSIPTAYIFGRLLKGIDIRQYGSGNVGATNAWRILGKGPGVAVLILDILKGFLVIVFLGGVISARISRLNPELLYILLGISCILGHNWTVFLKFKGGKGVSALLGLFLGLAVNITGLRIILLLSILTWLAVFFIARIVSVASVASCIALPVYMMLFKQSYPLIISSLILSAIITLRHKSNLLRFFQGKEPRLRIFSRFSQNFKGEKVV